MPIPREYFERAIDVETKKWMEETYKYLSKNRDKAYSADELNRFLLVDARFKGEEPSFQAALDKLVEIGAVEARRVKGVLYYALGERSLEEVLGKL